MQVLPYRTIRAQLLPIFIYPSNTRVVPFHHGYEADRYINPGTVSEAEAGLNT